MKRRGRMDNSSARSRYLAISAASFTAITSVVKGFVTVPLSSEIYHHDTHWNSISSSIVSSAPASFLSMSTPFVSTRPNSQKKYASVVLDLYVDNQNSMDGSYSSPNGSNSTINSKNINDDGKNNNPKRGKISLIGSGPGDPDLLTVAAYRMITDPTAFIVADRLVSPEILSLIEGEYKVARKLPGCAEKAQDEIYTWCEEALHQGKHVIRLKIGDPFVFGRGGEEVLTFRQMGYEPNVIPGVSAAFAAPLLGNIPVTHRGVSNQVVMCTGYGRNGTSPDLLKYHPEQTVVFLMAVGRLQDLCQNLITMAGYPSQTPVAIVEKAGCPEQRTLVGDMEDIADLAKEYEIKPPSTIVLGQVVHVLLGEEGEHVTHGLIDQRKYHEVANDA